MSEPLNLVLREIPTGFRIIDFGIPKEKMGNLVTRCCRPDDEPLAVLAIAQERTPFRDDGCNVVIATLRPVHAHVKLPVTRTTRSHPGGVIGSVLSAESTAIPVRVILGISRVEPAPGVSPEFSTIIGRK